MIESGLSYDRYRVDNTDEWLLRIGSGGGPTLLFLAPLLEEMNRTRALLVGTMRRLAERGWTCVLPDLPGTGESERALDSCSWKEWRAAVRAAAPADLAGIVAMRGGCLLDDAVASPCLWRFAPTEGASLARDLERAGLVSDGGAAGYALSAGFGGALAAAVPEAHPRLRTVRLVSERGAADRKIDHPPLWRRSEPQTLPELSELIASDVDEWMRACAAS